MKSYRSTVFACYVGYVVQAIVINFLPLLYVRFGSKPACGVHGNIARFILSCAFNKKGL
ncbi:MAG: hypothetical protein J6Z34_02250 [Clostridia bacterium]|nr:hypothetical protein [Clostridia bacterium]